MVTSLFSCLLAPLAKHLTNEAERNKPIQLFISWIGFLVRAYGAEFWHFFDNKIMQLCKSVDLLYSLFIRNSEQFNGQRFCIICRIFSTDYLKNRALTFCCWLFTVNFTVFFALVILKTER